MRTISAALAMALIGTSTVAVSRAPEGMTTDPKPEPPEPPAALPEPVVRNPISSRMTVAEAMANTGTSTPKQALKALNERGGKRYVYMPHTGAKERAKGLKQLEKERARLAAKDGAK